MESLEYIDDYFNGKKLPEETVQFEKRIAADPAFAEAVAFYINAREAAKEQLLQDKKERFRDIAYFHEMLYAITDAGNLYKISKK